jgi:tRNA (cytidine/uridine-2'-O-)-methyltransferase
MFDIILVNPEIPQNTGNIARTVFAENGRLHLVEPLSFSLEDRFLKRAGLDYWKLMKNRIWNSFEELESSIDPDRLKLFSTRGVARYDFADYKPGDYLVFGCESRGLSPELLDKYRENTYYLPMPNLHVRSINLASTVSAVLFEALRQNNFNE